jgi:hypothetical protein
MTKEQALHIMDEQQNNKPRKFLTNKITSKPIIPIAPCLLGLLSSQENTT